VSDDQDYRIELRIGRERVRLSAQIPAAPMSLLELLPIARSLADLTTQIAGREAQTLGRTVRCGPGCGACCRQLVPIAPVEALALRRTIEGLEPDHRARVLARFSEAQERLAQTGLGPRLGATLAQEGEAAGSRRTLGLAYFALSLPCPFLEEESCSIHPDRPLACREYLVSSDPAHCARPDADSVAVLEMPRRLSVLLSRLSESEIPGLRPWVPLTLALDETLFDAGAVGAAIGPGPALFEHLITLLDSGPLPAAGGPSQVSP
jgi:Fe-S-cluster containining protein